ENAEVESAVAADLHAAGAGRLQRTARIIQPDVDALDEIACDVDVVVLDEDDAAAILGTARDVVNLGDQFLAAVVARVCLSREDDLHRAVLVVDDGSEAV